MLGRRSQILTEGEHVDPDGAEITHGDEHFGDLFAHAEHQARFGDARTA